MLKTKLTHFTLSGKNHWLTGKEYKPSLFMAPSVFKLNIFSNKWTNLGPNLIILP